MDSAVQDVTHTALSLPTSIFMLGKRKIIILSAFTKFPVMKCCTPLHGMAVKQEVLRMGLRRVKWICFPHSLPVGCGKNIIYYTTFFSPKEYLVGWNGSRKGWKSAWPPRCCCHEWARLLPSYLPRGWALVVGQPTPQHNASAWNQNSFSWLLYTSILNKMSN